MTTPGWTTDVLPGHEQLTLTLASRDADHPVATLVRRTRRDAARPAVLYLHGWNDYFFQTHLSDFFAEQGYEFYALDLRRYGRSLRPGQMGGYVTDLAYYDDEIDQARELILDGGHPAVVLHGHSTGGLVAANHVAYRPHRYAALVLNSPWLDMNSMPLVRATAGQIRRWARVSPTSVLPGTTGKAGPSVYAQSLHRDLSGEWDYDLAWKSNAERFRIRAAWLRAVLLAQATVRRGMGIECPVLVATSASSRQPRELDPATCFAADIVLDTDALAANAVRIGRHVTVVRIPEGMHDLSLSRPGPRAAYFAATARWLAAYGPRA